MKTKRLLALLLMLSMLIGVMQTVAFANEEEICRHTNLTAIEGEEIDPTCFEPGSGGYWFCEECSQYLDASKENGYWEEQLASRIPALGHSFNTNTGKCDNCNLSNPVYTRVTSLDDVNEEDMYIIVAKVGNRYFVLGGLDESTSDNEMGVINCGDGGNAIEITPNTDGSISLLNQSYTGNLRPSELMLDIDPEQFNSDLDDNFGLTPVMLKLSNYCIYPFQSQGIDYNGYMGIPRYANGVYGMWDASEWIIDFYTTEVDENTYRDDMDGLTHAEQLARGNIDTNVSEGDLILYKGSFYAVGGAMFTVRMREYVNGDGTTEYYFICGEDGFLDGAGDWDPVTGEVPTNDTQYAVSLYRYDVPSAPDHTCEYVDYYDLGDGINHAAVCSCTLEKTEVHTFGSGIVTTPATETEEGVMTYTCTLCSYSRSESIPKKVANLENTDKGITLAVPNGSTAYIGEGTVLDADEIPTDDVPDDVIGDIALKLKGEADALAYYDLSLLLDGASVQPDGSVLVTLPAPTAGVDYDKVIVVYVAPDGSYEECETTVNPDGTVTFETDHFSKYALIGVSLTDNGGLPIGAVIGIIVGAVALVGGGVAVYWFVFRKKKPKE